MDEFIDSVKDALNHLYDYRYLEESPLAARCPEGVGSVPSARGLRLHRLLLQSIEELLPPRDSGFDSTKTRLYYILSYRYVEERTVAGIMRQLGLSRRQFFREQNKAITMLAGIVLEQLSGQPVEVTPTPEHPLEAEAARLGGRGEVLDIGVVLPEVLSFVEPLAQQHCVALHVEFDDPLPSVQANRVLVRQALLKVLSTLVSHGATQRISVHARSAGDTVRIEFATYSSAPVKITALSRDESVKHLIELAGGSHCPTHRTADTVTLSCEFPAIGQRSVLVVDDNEQIVSIFRRYLSARGFRVLEATTADNALHLAHDSLPDAITLDVMMPGQDGWEILRQLKADPGTSEIPVVVCSVLEDPALAYSLGAAAYLTKPVSQEDLFNSLRTLIDAPRD